MAKEKANIETLYDLAGKSKGSPEPKGGLFGAKCPKCGNKVSKETMKDMVYVGDDSTEFGKRVAKDASLELGVYDLTVEHFTCSKCGYNFAKAKIAPTAEDGI